MTITLLYGLYAAAVSIAMTLIIYFTGLWTSESSGWFGLVGYAFLIFFIYLAARERKQEDYDGVMSYGQGVGTGVMVGLLSGIVAAIFMWLYLTVINPEFVDVTIQRQADAMRHMQNMRPQDVDKAIEWTRKLFVPMGILGSLLMNVLVATLGSLIVAAFVKTKEEPVLPPVLPS